MKSYPYVFGWLKWLKWPKYKIWNLQIILNIVIIQQWRYFIVLYNTTDQ